MKKLEAKFMVFWNKMLYEIYKEVHLKMKRFLMEHEELMDEDQCDVWDAQLSVYCAKMSLYHYEYIKWIHRLHKIEGK